MRVVGQTPPLIWTRRWGLLPEPPPRRGLLPHPDPPPPPLTSGNSIAIHLVPRRTPENILRLSETRQAVRQGPEGCTLTGPHAGLVPGWSQLLLPPRLPPSLTGPHPHFLARLPAVKKVIDSFQRHSHVMPLASSKPPLSPPKPARPCEPPSKAICLSPLTHPARAFAATPDRLSLWFQQ